jgi:putative phosphoribosyl transferase
MPASETQVGGDEMFFRDRYDAGRQLAAELLKREFEDAVVLGLPRGGVPVAAKVADALGVPLDVLLVRKLGLPAHREFAVGAIGEGGVRVVDTAICDSYRVSSAELAQVDAEERLELDRRSQLYRVGLPPISLEGHTAILVDDGVATGSTALAASQVARKLGAKKVILAVPVGSASAVQELRQHVDEVICLRVPERFRAVGQWYVDFSETPDEQVVELLTRRRKMMVGTHASSQEVVSEPLPAGSGLGLGVELPVWMSQVDRDVEIRDNSTVLVGHLSVPERPIGVVLFAHGSGSSRHSPRNQAVAAVLNQARIATLLLDLLTPEEERERANVFDIPLLGRRLLIASEWLEQQPETAGVSLGYFGASTGAGAALWAAADPTSSVRAVVSRGGRPDLAGSRLSDVRASTLMIVGSHDPHVLQLNGAAAERLRCEYECAVVPGASHLFEEAGTLEVAAALARDWFVEHFSELLVPGGNR